MTLTHRIAIACFALLACTAYAQVPTCTGTDLLAQMQQNDPETYAKLIARADAVPNGKGRLWRVERADTDPSWLFGTMHRSDPRVLKLSPATAGALTGARKLLVELSNEASEAFQKKMTADPTIMMVTVPPFFDESFTAEQRKNAERVLLSYGIPYQGAKRMKPAGLFGMLSFSPCIMTRVQMGQPVLDSVLQGLGNDPTGLETPEEQWQILNSLGHDVYTGLLLAAFAQAEQNDDYHETILQAYLRGEMQLILEYYRHLNEENSEKWGITEDTMNAFMDILVNQRNRTMVERAKPHFRKGGVFLAVGSLHMPGEQGLVELLKQEGYTVTLVE